MLESARRRILAIPRVPTQQMLTIGTLASFGWLLLQNKIHPIIIYVLQVYLTF